MLLSLIEQNQALQLWANNMSIKGRIIDKTTKKSMEFRYFSGLGNTIAANYEEEDGVIGRSEPHVFYKNTSADIFNLTIQISASSEEKDTRTAKDVWDDYLYMKSFQLPDYGSNRSGPVKPPHQVILIVGNGFFRKTGIIKTPTFKMDGVADENGYPHVIEISFVFQVISQTSSSLMDCNSILAGTKYAS
jgi:hypothetical protein